MVVPLKDFPIYNPNYTPPPPPKVKPKGLQSGTTGADGKSTGTSAAGGGSAAAQLAADKLKTGKRYAGAARDLQSQITALKDAIKREFARSRRQNIGDISKMLDQQFTLMKDEDTKRGEDLLTAVDDADKATADVQEGGFRNMVRERADTLSAVLEQGAGETDAVRAMLMNARNWHANASDANRTYFDTMQSINQGITDLNVDSRSRLANAHMTAEGQKELVWQGFFNQRAEAMTNLGNTFGKRIEYLDQAKEYGVGADKKGKGKGKKPLAEGGGVLPGTKTFRDGGTKVQTGPARKGMKKSFAAASNELGKSYVQKDLPEWIEGYEVLPQQERRQENTNLASAPTMENVQRAQGATLRKWVA